ncbi:hypothetical protein T552_02275 [Pneumocystis carinii B80]|uniref:Lethal giant larvae (Lgl)-like C-terminal domain-containing protein n=1 Tax=Pneumocystis carinii (strain B80) TaxID=1408658 RepID=A0A0W4ZFY2_PNEC8|nr:hypothetical protein T552_02275 [Pneumocystis carinii B80]KTW27292.1 hypothetical protein T552_02275 [Pneumocystis carinii B80]
MSFFAKDRRIDHKNTSESVKYGDSSLCDELFSYGVSSGIRLATFDAIQSLLAIATFDSKIYIFKEKNIKVQYSLPKHLSIRQLLLHDSFLIAIDSINTIYSWSLDKTSIMPTTVHSIRGNVTCIGTDPSIDWLFIGLKDGTVDVWDIDRECIAPYKIANLYSEKYERLRQKKSNSAPPRSYISPIISIQIHPRDLGMILIGYSDGVVLYSFKKNMPISFFDLEIPQKIPETNSTGKIVISRPKLTGLSWAPHGHHFVVSYQNGCFAFWSTKSNKYPLQVRTLDDVRIDTILEEKTQNNASQTAYTRSPIFFILWNCNDDLENTSVFIVGGNLNNKDSKELNILEFGQSPSMSSSDCVFTDYYSKPKQHHALSHFLSSNVVNICVFPERSPQYSGNYNIEMIMLILASGEIELLSYPDGIFLNSLKLLPSSLEWLSPKICDISLSFVSKNTSFGYRKYIEGHDHLYQRKGSTHHKLLYHNEVISSGHDNGIIRLYNVTQDYKFEKIHEIFLAKLLNLPSNMIKVVITKFSEMSDLIIGCESGELIVYKLFSPDKKTFEFNDSHDSSMFNRSSKKNDNNTLKSDSYMINKNSVSSNNSKNQNNLSSVSVFQIHRGSVVSLKTSNIGLLACGYEFGTTILINTFTRNIILQIELTEIKTEKKKSKSFKNARDSDDSELEVAVTFEFTTGKFKKKDSSVLFIIGTSFGRLIFYNLFLSSENKFNVEYMGEILFENGSIINIISIFKNTLRPYILYPSIFDNLRNNSISESYIIIIAENSVKVLDSYFFKISEYFLEKDVKCLSANIVYQESIDVAIACLINNRKVFLLSFPDLNDLFSVNLPHLFIDKLNKTIITIIGVIYLWVNEMELSLFNLFGNGIRITEFPSGILYDSSKKVPPRPTISTWEWITGTKYITAAELDSLIGGPDRPLPKKLLQSLAEQKLKNKTEKKAHSACQQNEHPDSYGNIFVQTTENIRERGRKIFDVGEKLEFLEESSVNMLKRLFD